MTDPSTAARPGYPLETRLSIGRARGLWRAALDAGDETTALNVAENLSIAEASSADAREMQGWSIEARLRAGRPDQAREALNAYEARHGADDVSRLGAARLAYFAGDLEGCAAACGEAAVLTPAGPGAAERQGQIVRRQADALGLAGRPKAARAVMEAALTGRAATDRDLKVLRDAVSDAEDLDAFRGRLLPALAEGGSARRAALYHYGMACRSLGLERQATDVMRRRLIDVAGDVAFGGRAPTGPKPPSNKDRIFAAGATAAVRDLTTAFGQAGRSFFLISGTLLGRVRDGGLLKGEKDIDIGALDEGPEARTAIEAALRAAGVFSVKPAQSPGLLRLHHASGAPIDLFWHRREGGRLIHGGMKCDWWNTAFDLSPMDFLGSACLAPADADRYLTESYGDWRKPDPDFEVFAESPNMIAPRAGELAWHYYNRLHDHYLTGRGERFRRIADALAWLRPPDPTTGALIAGVLRDWGDLGPPPVAEPAA